MSLLRSSIAPLCALLPMAVTPCLGAEAKRPLKAGERIVGHHSHTGALRLRQCRGRWDGIQDVHD